MAIKKAKHHNTATLSTFKKFIQKDKALCNQWQQHIVPYSTAHNEVACSINWYTVVHTVEYHCTGV